MEKIQDPLKLQRNRKIVERWHYWTEVKRIRFDDAMKNLQDEFFVRELTITRAIRNNQDYFNEIITKHKHNENNKRN